MPPSLSPAPSVPYNHMQHERETSAPTPNATARGHDETAVAAVVEALDEDADDADVVHCVRPQRPPDSERRRHHHQWSPQQRPRDERPNWRSGDETRDDAAPILV